jgi:putative transposase
MTLIDELYMKCPFYGSRKMAPALRVNRKHVQRQMRLIGIEAVYAKRRTIRPGTGHEIYP